MKKLNKKMQVLGAVTLAAGLASQAKAGIVDYTVTGVTLENVSFETYNGSGYSTGGGLAGGIGITENPNIGDTPATYVSVCTDLSGTLYLNKTYSYNTPVPVPPTGYTSHPSWGTNPTAAIENAALLFANFSSQLSSSDTAAGLQLAVWTALYDSSNIGKVNDSANNDAYFVALSSGTSVTAYSTLTSDLAWLSGQTSYNGNVEILTPNPDSGTSQPVGSNQNDAPQGLLYNPVPEASTVLSGSLLLLSFGVCSLKSFGKSRA
jgi:hypothetical protein